MHADSVSILMKIDEALYYLPRAHDGTDRPQQMHSSGRIPFVIREDCKVRIGNYMFGRVWPALAGCVLPMPDPKSLVDTDNVNRVQEHLRGCSCMECSFSHYRSSENIGAMSSVVSLFLQIMSTDYSMSTNWNYLWST